MQVIMLKAVVEQAQRVRIRNLSLLTWLSEMRAAALDGEDVLQRGPAGDDDDDEPDRALARVERVSSTIANFLKLLQPQIQMSATEDDGGASDQDGSCRRTGGLDDDDDTSSESDNGSYSYRQALLTSEPDTERLQRLVNEIRAVVHASDRVEVHGSRWLARWRRELQVVADRADRVLPALPAPDEQPATPPVQAQAPTEATTSSDELTRTAQSVETAAAHLDNFLTLVRFIAMDRASSAAGYY